MTANEIKSIEALLEQIKCLQVEKEALIAGQETLQKALAEKIAEVERVRNIIFGCDLSITSIKTDAIKEFAERLRREFSQCQREYRNILNNDGACAMIIAKNKVDNLVKEWCVMRNDIRNQKTS